MRLLSWNVQYGKSANGHFDFLQTLNHIAALGDFDVICLQEIARHMPDHTRPDQADQLQLASQHFNDYYPVWGSGFSWPGKDGDELQRQEFGNLTLCKASPLDYRVHQLPQPVAPGKRQMPRVAVEVCVASTVGPLSIINTHLAFHDSDETQAQVEHLVHLENERITHQQSPRADGPGCFGKGFRGAARIITGDFNIEPETSHYRTLIEHNWLDAWHQASPQQPPPATCGIFDTQQWPQGGHCRDYFWLSKELASFEINASVDSATSLSDHQPIMLEVKV